MHILKIFISTCGAIRNGCLTSGRFNLWINIKNFRSNDPSKLYTQINSRGRVESKNVCVGSENPIEVKLREYVILRIYVIDCISSSIAASSMRFVPLDSPTHPASTGGEN